MIDKRSVDLSHYRLEKSKDLLTQAKLLHENQKPDGSINRSYYAIFNPIRALLALIKLDSSKHSRVISILDRYFVNANIFDKKFSKMIHSAFDTRQENDYEDFYKPSTEKSYNQLNDAELFINEVEMKIGKILKKDINLPEIENK